MSRFSLASLAGAATLCGVAAVALPSVANQLKPASSGLLAPIVTVPGELDMLLKHGHIQGATCSETAIYLCHAGGIVKLDWRGRLLKTCDAPNHLNDIAYADGRIYGTGGLHDDPGGRVGYVAVWDEDLNAVAEHRCYELLPEYRGLGPAVVLDGMLYTGSMRATEAGKTNIWAHPPHRDVVVMALSTNDLSVLWKKEVLFDYPIHFGTQTFETDGENLLFGNYGAKREEGNTRNLNFTRTTKDLKLLDSHNFQAAEGIARVPKSVCGRDAPVYFRVTALGGNMQGWRKDPKGNPPRVMLEFFEYDRATGAMRNITDYSMGDGVTEPESAEHRASAAKAFRDACAAAGQAGAFCLGAATSMEKVRPREGPFPNAAKRLSVRLARGETEAVQLFVMPRAGALRNVSVAVDMGMSGFAASNVTVAVLGYVNITKRPPYKAGVNESTDEAPGYRRKAVPCSLGWWPDPILSHVGCADVAEGDLQGFWISVRAPENQKPGRFDGRVLVNADGAVSVSLPLSVRVNGFSVPKTPMLPVAVSFSPWTERWGEGDEARVKRCGRDPLSPVNAWRSRKVEWCDFLADHFLSWDWLYCVNGRWPDFDMLKRQAHRGLLGRYNLGYWLPPVSVTNEADVAKWRRDTLPRLTAAYEKAVRAGMADRAYLYGCDEANADDFGRIAFAAAELKRAMPGVPLLTTAYDKDYGVGSPLSALDWFAPQTAVFDAGRAEKARSAGKQVWWYFACDQKAPYANSFVECQAIEMRSVMGAQAVKFRPDGFLYYQTSIWNSDRPIGDNSFTSWEPRSWHGYHGDGSWMCVGPDGIPLSSIRLENFADGLEDYAYAMILERKLKEAENGMLKIGDEWVNRARELLAVPREVVDSVKNFSDDPAVLYRWRDAMADLIEAAMGDA